ncbi:hypothetical protein COLO4_13011 [Corchorus olitorius]|uniref:Terpene synthase metal-binding domain-containing protein n=1 Tax=Corchorus olitorius TaxID=93759 RepID=A0A1R3JYM4_9ROSI|nr:hypothetical protein COLO4_13011 [Corchorus olitorius]
MKCQSRLQQSDLMVLSEPPTPTKLPNQRRSANYHPTIWEPKLIQSFTTHYSYKFHGDKLEELKKEARILLAISQDDPCATLKLIDLMQRLGVAYHFEKEIDEALHKVSKPTVHTGDLYTTSLLFRLLRQHAFPISTAIDDMYDVYGSLDELELFTTAVNRWDISAMKDLPQYMKACYLALLNFVDEMGHDILKDHELDITHYIREEWKKLCRSYLREARWFYKRYTPGLKEYLETAWISVGGPAAMVHAYILQADSSSMTQESLDDCFKNGRELIHWSSLITRLSDDLGTSMHGDGIGTSTGVMKDLLNSLIVQSIAIE